MVTVLEVKIRNKRRHSADCSGHALERICSGCVGVGKVNSSTLGLVGVLEAILIVACDEIRRGCQTGQFVLDLLR